MSVALKERAVAVLRERRKRRRPGNTLLGMFLSQMEEVTRAGVSPEVLDRAIDALAEAAEALHEFAAAMKAADPAACEVYDSDEDVVEVQVEVAACPAAKARGQKRPHFVFMARGPPRTVAGSSSADRTSERPGR